VQLLWNLTDDVVGKITSISLNVQANVVVTGSTFTPVTQVSAVALDTGKVLSKATPDSQFSYSTALSKDGSRTAVYGCAVQTGKDCTLSVFKGTDVSSAPVWREKIKGYQWWGAAGVKIADDASLVAVGALKQFPQVVQPVPAVLSWFSDVGQLISNYSMALSLGEVWANAKLVASREFTSSQGYLRILTSKTPSTNCSLESDYEALGMSPSFDTIVQPFVDSSKNVFVKQQSGGQQCADNWQWALPAGQELIALGTSDVATVVASLSGLTISFFVFPKASNADPPKPASFQVTLPSDYPVDINEGDVHFAFSNDGVHAGIAVAGMGIYYLNVQTAPSSPVQVYSHDNPCGILSMAVGPNASGDVFLVVDFNQLINVSPDELDCMDGGDGLSAFKYSK
jgi:hypothetical protein